LPSPILIENWEWQGDEETLATICEENERLREQRECEARIKSEKGKRL
jgi:hypothetical protein